ncbi:hypothetical protein AMK16_25595 [Streptomyces sp. CB00455]|nr:hypothetical protein [Streptomyces sp. CB00455]OKK16098.1 hypothetical protein AMK16_25595 [Streptomyces sp. CB00455]
MFDPFGPGLTPDRPVDVVGSQARTVQGDVEQDFLALAQMAVLVTDRQGFCLNVRSGALLADDTDAPVRVEPLHDAAG